MKVVAAHEVKHDIMKYAFFERGHLAVVTEGLNQADVLGITGSREAVEFEIKVSRSDLKKELAAIRYATMTMVEGKDIAKPDTPEQAALNLEFAGLKQKSGGWTKISKHQEYINPKKYFEDHRRYLMDHRYIPNYFYMVVPDKLVAFAKEELQGTGYGVIAYDGCRQEGRHSAYFKDGAWYSENEPEGSVWRSGAPCEFSRRGCLREVAVKQKARKIHTDPIAEVTLMSILSRAVTENIVMLSEIVRMGERIKKLEEEIEAKK